MSSLIYLTCINSKSFHPVCEEKINRTQKSTRVFSILEIKITLDCITTCCLIDVQFPLKRSTFQMVTLKLWLQLPCVVTILLGNLMCGIFPFFGFTSNLSSLNLLDLIEHIRGWKYISTLMVILNKSVSPPLKLILTIILNNA